MSIIYGYLSEEKKQKRVVLVTPLHKIHMTLTSNDPSHVCCPAVMSCSTKEVSAWIVVGGIPKRQQNYFCHILSKQRQMRRPTSNVRTGSQSSVSKNECDIDDEKLIAYYFYEGHLIYARKILVYIQSY